MRYGVSSFPWAGSSLRAVWFLCAAMVGIANAHAQATYQFIGPDGADTWAAAYGVSADGTIVVGNTGLEAFRWTQAGGYERLGWLPDPSPASSARAISADGLRIVGWSSSTQHVTRGFVWEASTGMVPLEPISYSLPVALSGAYAIGFQGQWIGGYSYDVNIDQATVWDAPTNPLSLDPNGLQNTSYVNAIAAEAPYAVGTYSPGAQAEEGFRYHAATGWMPIGFPVGATRTRMQCVSADGQILFGTALFGQGWAPVRWSTQHGFEVLSGAPTNSPTTHVWACNAAGTVAVGVVEDNGVRKAFYWSEATGFAFLKAFLADRGATGLFSSTRLDPRALSADGNVIVGSVGTLPNAGWFRAQLSPTDPVALGTSYCGPSVPNTLGASPELYAFGSPRIADNDLVLWSEHLPRDSFAILLASPTQGFTPGYQGSQGNLCLGGPIGRFRQIEQVRFTGRYQRTGLRLDLEAIAQPAGAVAVQSGETWNFQMWYRDHRGVPQSNLTAGCSVTFQ